MKIELIILLCVLVISIATSVITQVVLDDLWLKYNASPPANEVTGYWWLKFFAILVSVFTTPIMVYHLFSNRKKATIISICTSALSFYIFLYFYGHVFGFMRPF